MLDTQVYPRLPVDGRTEPWVHGIDEVSLLKIGALIEHGQVNRTGATVNLDLIPAGRETNVCCRVIWSMVHRRVQHRMYYEYFGGDNNS